MNITKAMAWVGVSAALACAAACLGADSDASAVPELQGILVTRAEPRFALLSPGGERSGWLALGESFAGWKLVAYRATESALVVDGGHRSVTLPLRNGRVLEGADEPAARATVDEADAVLVRMNFDAMWDRIVTEQKRAITGAIRPQLTAEFTRAGVTPEEIDVVLGKMGDVLVAGMQADTMRRDFARIYTEVYTAEELRGMASFYDTAAGRAWVEKQPDVQQKMMQLLMPRVMQGMPAAQKIAADYFRQRTTARPGAGAPP